MKIKSIEYGESVQTSYDTWKKLSLTAELEEGDKEEDAINKLQSRVSEFMKKQTEIASVNQFKSPQKTTTDAHLLADLEGINGSTSIEELKTFHLRAKNNLSLLTAYNEKEKELSNAK